MKNTITSTTKNTVTVKKSELVLKTDEIAKGIKQIKSAMEGFDHSELNQTALVVLLNHSTKVPMSTIKKVLDGLNSLDTQYLKLADEVKGA